MFASQCNSNTYLHLQSGTYFDVTAKHYVGRKLTRTALSRAMYGNIGAQWGETCLLFGG